MSEEIWVKTNLTTETCVDCGVTFVMPRELREQRIRDLEAFYCPNGHSMSFLAEKKRADSSKKTKK